MSAASKPMVLVVENPDAPPDVITIGEVEVVETSTYPLSGFIPDSELAEYSPRHYAEIADHFPVDSEPYKVLMGFQKEFENHLQARGVSAATIVEHD